MKKGISVSERKSKSVLILRTCNADMSSHGGFVWPNKGNVKAADWAPTKQCGQGLHGLLWGEGDGSLMKWEPDAKWLVVKAAADSIIDLDGKVKFPAGEVVHCGDRKSATEYIVAHGAKGSVVGGTATAGDGGTATAGDGGTATAGDGGTATAGYRGTATAGDGGTATAGYRGILNIRWYDGNRYRLATFYVGESGVKERTPYRCDEKGQIVDVKAKGDAS